ncbi:MAG: GDP-mannose 4,6-dehydratase [Candidatus Omnitrophica bacterium]|nr:GDP-mannose 4,6-dehydratase [Candidatus Omnitrophota bacterium]MDD5591923.1 GDP-mannose 4,6-dehydratase [Candidatus Omnitrophota bacterium]
MDNLEVDFKGKNVMVTGGLGFIGSNLAHKLVEFGANVSLVDSLMPDYGGNLFNIHGIENKVSVNISDVRDENNMRLLVKEQDYIFNLAGQVSHLDSMKDPFTDLEINCRAQLSILEACKKNNRDAKIVFTSTRQVYGKPDYLPVDEKHLLHPIDINGINKMAGEWYHILYNNVYNIKTTSLRLTNTYGPRLLMKHNRQGFVAWFVRQAIENDEIKIFGDGNQIRDFNYVDDVVGALLLVGAKDETSGKIYNLGNTERMCLREFVRVLIDVCGSGTYTIVPFPEEKRKIDIGDYYGDFNKIKKELGWEPVIFVREGLERTIEYYKKYSKYYW